MTPHAPLRFRSDVTLNVRYEDRTPFGSPHGQGPDLTARRAFAPLIERLTRADDPHDVLAARGEVLRAVAEQPLWRTLVRPDGDSWAVRPEVLYPDPDANRPRLLTVARPDTDRVVRGRLPDEYWPAVHELTTTLSLGSLTAKAMAALPDPLQQMVGAFAEQDLLEVAPHEPGAPQLPAVADADVVFLGHNTVLVRSATTSVIVDPLLFAHSTANPDGYQPLLLRDLGTTPDAVVITHSHPDHFDPASLLRFPLSTTVVVPYLERETLLAVDLARRAAELGFSDIRALRWDETTTVGDITVRAHPFYGEQPTDTAWIHPEVRNQGCTYRIDTPTTSAVFMADSGVDHLGDPRELALAARRHHGPVDVVFCGYRGWLLFPYQLLASSVARYFLLVPPDLWQCRMTLMATADMALDIAERWGAAMLCAYADGGAPWHWRLGLGPRLDGGADEMFAFDPFPERMVVAATRRSCGPRGNLVRSPVTAHVLRPGQGLHRADLAMRAIEDPRCRWPYATPPAQESNAEARVHVG